MKTHNACHLTKSVTLNDEFAVAKKGSGIIFLQGFLKQFTCFKKRIKMGHFLIKLGCSVKKAQLELGLKESHSLHQELLVGLRVRPVGSPGQLDKVAVWEELPDPPDLSIVPPEGFLFS